MIRLKLIRPFIFMTLVTSKLFCQTGFNNYSSCNEDTLFDNGYKVMEDHSGNFVACGMCYNSSKSIDGGYVVKANASGHPVWKKYFDFSTGHDNINDVLELPDKHYLFAGTAGDFYASGSHAFLAKTDSNGILVWYKQYSNVDYDMISEMKLTPDNKIILLGSSYPSSQTNNDILLIKTDLNGNLLWRKTIGSHAYSKNYTSIKVIRNNTQYLLGGSQRSGSTDDIGVVRLDTAGNILWSAVYTNANFNEVSYTLENTYDGGYVLGGKTNFGMIWKLDSTGVLQWTKLCGNTPGTSSVRTIKQLKDSNLIVAATDAYLHSSTITLTSGNLMLLNKNGTVIWENFYKGTPGATPLSSNFWNLSICKDKGFIMTGITGNISTTKTDLWLVKTDSMGNGAIPLSVKQLSSGYLNAVIYPNPNSGSFSVLYPGMPDAKNVTTTIYNTLGQVMLSLKGNANENGVFEFKETHLNAGMYFIELEQNGGVIAKNKVMVE